MNSNIRQLLYPVIATMLVFSPNTYANDPILGAFGVKLGSQFLPSEATGSWSLTDGTPLRKFQPSSRFRSFKNYFVLTTPKTNLIYGIWALGDAENDEKCKKEQALIIAILEQKYGTKEEEQLFGSLYDIEEVDQGNRHVLTKCSGYSDVSIDIRYYDKKLKQQAEVERILLESEKVDSSSL